MDKRRVVLRNGNVLTKLEVSEESKGLLYVPPLLRDQRYKKVRVMQASGEIEEGNTLYVPLAAGTEVEIEGEIFLIVNERDILLYI